MSLHPRRRIVRAATDGIELVTIPNVELLEVGEDWETSTGTFTFTADDLQSAVDAISDPSVRTPVLKFGHVDPRFDGDFSLGRVENLHLENNGMTLVGDYVGVPAWLAQIMGSAYPRRSVEGRWDFETYTGNRWPFYLTAVALLGASYPAIATIEDIKNFWEGGEVEMVDVAANADPPYIVGTPRGIVGRASRVEAANVSKWRTKSGKVEASVEVDDIRRQYYDSLEASQMWWWIRAIQIDPAQLIVDDDEGSLYRVAYTTDGDEVTFADPIKVKVEYVDVPSGKAAAAAASWAPTEATVATYPTRNASRHDTVSAHEPEREEAMTPEQKALIGLSADADDAAVSARLTELAAAAGDGETKPDETTPQNPTTTPANPTTPASPAGPPGDPNAPPPEPPANPTPERPDVPEGMVLVDATAWAETQRVVKDVSAKMADDETNRRKGVVAAAVKAGKIPPSRREHYETLMASDPAGTEGLLDTLAPGLIPVGAEIGIGEADGVAAADNAYPSDWLPEVHSEGGARPTIQKEV